MIAVPTGGKLTAQAERLAEIHRQRGLTVKVVPANLLYNEFSSGTPDANALRRYLKMLYDRAATPDKAPRYLLLMGKTPLGQSLCHGRMEETLRRRLSFGLRIRRLNAKYRHSQQLCDR